jgi:hypothetical protein
MLISSSKLDRSGYPDMPEVICLLASVIIFMTILKNSIVSDIPEDFSVRNDWTRLVYKRIVVELPRFTYSKR